MRVTNNIMISNFLNDLAKIEERSADTQKKISSGLEITKPSDDPSKATRILFFDSQISKVQQYQKNIDHVMTWTSQTNTILNNMYDDYSKAQELAQRGANGTYNQTQLNDMAEEVNGLLEKVVSSANDKIENYYAFGGNNIATAPFIITRNANNDITGVAFDPNSNNGPRIEEVLAGQTKTVNEIGGQLMYPNGLNDYFTTLINLRDNLRAGNTAATSTSLTDVKAVINDIDKNVARIGGKEAQLGTIKTRLADTELSYATSRAGLQDVDFAKAITSFQKDQTLYQSTLAVGARLMQTSLIDFLK
jgi:flagellar hook-associated protein 3 FlgL